MDKRKLELLLIILVVVAIWAYDSFDVYDIYDIFDSYVISGNTHYEKDPEYVKLIEETYGAENILYVDGRSYCIINIEDDGRYEFPVSVCGEGDERLANTLLRSEDQFFRDRFFSINKASMSTDRYGKSEVTISVKNNERGIMRLEIYLDFFDEDGVVIGQDDDVDFYLEKNEKCTLTGEYLGYGLNDPEAEYFRIRKIEFDIMPGYHYEFMFE